MGYRERVGAGLEGRGCTVSAKPESILYCLRGEEMKTQEGLWVRHALGQFAFLQSELLLPLGVVCLVKFSQMM